MVKRFTLILLFLFCWSIQAQQSLDIVASLQAETKTIHINQSVNFTNTSNKVLTEIYFTDWANSFSSKTTPLGNRFSEDYERLFHFEKDEERGRTSIASVTANNNPLNWSRGDEADILIVTLNKPLAPKETAEINFQYTVKVPKDKFTRFGVSRSGKFHLRYWFITPAVLKNNKWQAYSNKDLGDLYMAPTDISLQFNYPTEYHLYSDLNLIKTTENSGIKTSTLTGENRVKLNIHLDQEQHAFTSYETDITTVTTSIPETKLPEENRALFIDRIVHFIDDKSIS